MLARKYLFPHVIEMNYQAGRRLGVNVYLIDGGTEFALIDIGYLDGVDEIIELIRQMDFTCPPANGHRDARRRRPRPRGGPRP